MKKLFAILLAAALLLGFAACGNKEKKDQEEQQPLALTLVTDFGGDNGVQEYPFDNEGEVTVQALAAGLTELTGLGFIVTAENNSDVSLTVDWTAESALFAGPSEEQKDNFHFFDYDSMAWFALDSLYRTIVKNIPGIQEVFYTMDGGRELVLENLSPPVAFGDSPYILRGYYLAMEGLGDIIEEEPIDPADVNWWGEYGSEKGLLNIVNYNGRSFRFTFDNDGVIEDGVAALDPETAILASYEKYEFRFNLEQDTISVWFDGGSAVDYFRTADAMG